MPTRLVAAVTALAAACLIAASASPAAVTVVHRGQLVHLGLTWPPSSSPFCVVNVSYADNNLWQSSVKQMALGKVGWTFRIPRNATLGPAHWSIRCGPIWHKDGQWRVAAAVPAA